MRVITCFALGVLLASVLGCCCPCLRAAATPPCCCPCPKAAATAPCCCPCMKSSAAPGAEPMLAHNVFFTLKENTPQNRDALIEACRTCLKGHPGEVFFAAGSLAEDLAREVNVRDFQVGLHVVFATKELHDQYQVAPRHKEFVEKHQGLWQQVRVFDTYVR